MALKQVVTGNKCFDISYDIVNPQAHYDLIILHGWGSNKEIMKQAFAFTMKEFRHIYIDMPGFGNSSNDYILTTQDYAAIIDEFLSLIQASKLAIIGHSFGGKVATLLNPENLILLSSAGIIEEKALSVKFKIFCSKILNPLGLKQLNKLLRSQDVDNMNQNMYETFKNVLNEDFSSKFVAYQKNALIFWGKTDTATSLTSGKRISELIVNSTIKVYPEDHYFFLKNSQDIGNEIVRRIL